MSELRPTEPPPRPLLLHTLTEQLGQIVPGWRCIGREILAESSRIDLVGASGAGDALVVAVGGPQPDLTLVARALAQREWLAPRLRDWLQLAPDLGLDPDAAVGALVLHPDPDPETRAAARALPADLLRLGRYRFVANGSATGVLLDLLEDVALREGRDAEAPPAPALHAPAPDAAEPPPAFRTGLTDAELGLSDDERSEFE